MSDSKLLDVAHVTKRGSSLRITVPKPVVTELGISPADIVGFYIEDGKICLKKIG